MRETVAIIWLWITAGGLTLIGGLLFYMLSTGQTLHNGAERRNNMKTTAGMVAVGGALIVLLLAGCTTIPEHCRDWGDPVQCAKDHPADEFRCDDNPQPGTCGLE